MYLNHFFAAMMLILTFISLLPASENADQDKTLSPYFVIDGDGSNGGFPLLSNSANVNISGVIADVVVTQVYKNDGSKPIEAIYVFPASTRAAVYALRMTLGGRTIDALVKERQQARADYETARQEGKSASLLEQQRPNVFQMSVANIMPGDTIRVELRYTELIIPVENIYEFSYPTVVGPRYSNKSDSEIKQSDKWVSNPYLHQGQKPTYTFDIKVGIRTAIPIQEMTCQTHKVNIQYDNPGSASASLGSAEKDGGNRDFILKYRLAGNKIESGMLLYKGKEENFFCMMVQPPQRITNDNIPPREYIFVVDVSGSMNGFPLDISKELLKKLISGLRQSDCFNVILFAGVSDIMSEKSLPATAENIKKAIDVIDRQQGGGGTELLPALERSLRLPRNEVVSRSIIVITDGYVDVETQAFDLIRKNLDNANLFAFGIGSSVNRLLIEGMARVGGGEPFVITTPDKASEIAESFRKYIQNPVLTQIKYSFDGFSAYDVEPVSIPDVMASRPVIIYGKWKGSLEGHAKVSGYTGGKQKYEQSFDIRSIEPSENNSALRYLWARNRIAILDDYNNLSSNDERVKEVTDIGLTYNLLTAYTSFIAIDNVIRNKSGNVQTVNQPLPLPMGVKDLAVGNAASMPMKRSLFGLSAAPPAQNHNYGKGVVAMEMVDISDELAKQPDKIEKEQKLNETTSGEMEIVNPEGVQLQGKTILYFWNTTITGALNEIENMITFALKNPDVKIYVINTEKIDLQTLKQILGQVTEKKAMPANMFFTNDSRKVLFKYAKEKNISGQNVHILFTDNGVIIRNKNNHLNFWSENKRILDLFK